MKNAICLSHSRDKAIQIKKMFDHLGFSQVQASIYDKAPDIDTPSLCYIEYTYEYSEVISRLVEKLAKKNCIILLHHLEVDELFLEELMVRYPNHTTSVSGALNLQTLRDKVSRVKDKSDYLSKFKNVENFTLSSELNKILSLASTNNEVANFIVSATFLKRKSVYRTLLRLLPPANLTPFHYLNYVEMFGYPKNDKTKAYELVKVRKLSYYANKAIAVREFRDGHFSSCISYASDALEKNPLNIDLLVLILSSSAFTGRIEKALAALRVRQRAKIFNIEDFKQLMTGVLTNVISSNESMSNLVDERKKLAGVIQNMERKFGLANKSVFRSILKGLSIFIMLRSNKREAAVILHNKDKSPDANDLFLVLLNKMISSEIGNIRESRDNFIRFKDLTFGDIEGYRKIYKHNYSKHTRLLEGYRKLASDKQGFDLRSIMQLYKQYPLSLELNMLMSQRIILEDTFVTNTIVRKRIARNIRVLNAIRHD